MGSNAADIRGRNMKRAVTTMALLLLIGIILLTGSGAIAAPASPALLKAKQEAEAKGYVFLTSHEEIVEKAKAEGKLRVLTSQEPEAIKATVKAFKEKYPFIDVRAEEIAGVERYQRMLQEMKAGLAKAWDVNHVAFDSYNEYLPYQKKLDILGMAQHGVLRTPSKLVDPVNRHVVALQSNVQVVAYNKELISGEKIPDTWEGFLTPEFKGKKFLLEVRAQLLSTLVPLWGLEKTLEFARKIAAQEPIWNQGQTRLLTQMVAGEFALYLGPNFRLVKKVQAKALKPTLDYKVVEPVPARLSGTQAILATAANPYAGLLWLEFQTSAEGQKILDDTDFAATIFTPGSLQEQLTRGRKVSALAWEHYSEMGKYEEEIIKASGFPRAEKK
jgi:ABC-type Fe3+ transport system substrate-binding protein